MSEPDGKPEHDSTVPALEDDPTPDEAGDAQPSGGDPDFAFGGDDDLAAGQYGPDTPQPNG